MASNQEHSVSVGDLALPIEEIYRAMGYGESTPEEEVCALTRELLEEAKRVARPGFYYSVREGEIGRDGTFVAEGREYAAGRTIAGLLRGSSQVALFVATAGREFQEWMERVTAEGDMIATFIVDSIGSVIAEAAGDYMERELERELAGLKHTNRFSPGYCGWDVVEQHKLFGQLPDGVCGITLSESSLMHPIKSISGVVGIGESVITKKYGCSICKRLDCYLRRK